MAIEHLPYENNINRNFINYICQLKSLKSLDIIFSTTFLVTESSCLIDSARNLPNPENLNIGASYKLKVLIQMLKHANRLSELNITLRSDFVLFDENDNDAVSEVVKKRADHRRLKIKIKMEKNNEIGMAKNIQLQPNL